MAGPTPADPLDLTQWERTLMERALAESGGNPAANSSESPGIRFGTA